MFVCWLISVSLFKAYFQFLCVCVFCFFSELCEKKDSFLLLTMTLPTIPWLFMNVVDVYSVYYNTSLAPFMTRLLSCLPFASYILVIARWVMLAAKEVRGSLSDEPAQYRRVLFPRTNDYVIGRAAGAPLPHGRPRSGSNPGRLNLRFQGRNLSTNRPLRSL